MGKRGEETGLILWAFYLVLVGIIVFTLTGTINRLGQKSSFEDKYIAVDVSLLLDTIQLAPGKLDLNYNYGKRELSIKDNMVISNDIWYYYSSNINNLSIKSQDNSLIIKK